MSLNASNILVGAAAVAVGGFDPTWVGTVDDIWTDLKSGASGSPKDFRALLQTFATTARVISGKGTVTWRDAGLTTAGVEIQYNPTYGEVAVDQVLDAAKLFRQNMTVMVNTTFAEATLENLLVTWGQSDYAYQNPFETNYKSVVMTGGNLGDAPRERALFFVGNAPNTNSSYKQRVYVASRAISVAQTNHTLARDSATEFAVSFRLLPDTSASYAAYGRIVDILA